MLTKKMRNVSVAILALVMVLAVAFGINGFSNEKKADAAVVTQNIEFVADNGFGNLSKNGSLVFADGVAKLIATDKAELKSGSKNKVGYDARKINLVLKFDKITTLTLLHSSNNTGGTKYLQLLSFTSTDNIESITTSSYSSATVVPFTRIATDKFGHDEAGQGVVTESADKTSYTYTTKGCINITYENLAPGYYVVKGPTDETYLYGFSYSYNADVQVTEFAQLDAIKTIYADSMTVADLNLPATVTGIADGEEEEFEVVWDTTSLDLTGTADVNTTLSGTVTIPEGYQLATGISSTVSIAVKIYATAPKIVSFATIETINVIAGSSADVLPTAVSATLEDEDVVVLGLVLPTEIDLTTVGESAIVATCDLGSYELATDVVNEISIPVNVYQDTLISVAQINKTVSIGAEYTLPETVTATFTSEFGAQATYQAEVAVTWDSTVDTSVEAELVINGTIATSVAYEIATTAVAVANVNVSTQSYMGWKAFNDETNPVEYGVSWIDTYPTKMLYDQGGITIQGNSSVIADAGHAQTVAMLKVNKDDKKALKLSFPVEATQVTIQVDACFYDSGKSGVIYIYDENGTALATKNVSNTDCGAEAADTAGAFQPFTVQTLEYSASQGGNYYIGATGNNVYLTAIVVTALVPKGISINDGETTVFIENNNPSLPVPALTKTVGGIEYNFLAYTKDGSQLVAPGTAVEPDKSTYYAIYGAVNVIDGAAIKISGTDKQIRFTSYLYMLNADMFNALETNELMAIGVDMKINSADAESTVTRTRTGNSFKITNIIAVAGFEATYSSTVSVSVGGSQVFTQTVNRTPKAIAEAMAADTKTTADSQYKFLTDDGTYSCYNTEERAVFAEYIVADGTAAPEEPGTEPEEPGTEPEEPGTEPEEPGTEPEEPGTEPEEPGTEPEEPGTEPEEPGTEPEEPGTEPEEPGTEPEEPGTEPEEPGTEPEEPGTEPEEPGTEPEEPGTEPEEPGTEPEEPGTEPEEPGTEPEEPGTEPEEPGTEPEEPGTEPEEPGTEPEEPGTEPEEPGTEPEEPGTEPEEPGTEPEEPGTEPEEPQE